MLTTTAAILAAQLYAGSVALAAEEAPVPHIETNPLLSSWEGPFGGLPPFRQAELGHFKPALESAMAEYLAEIDAVANNPEPATFENTLAALEDSGRALDRVETVYDVFLSTMSTPELRELESDMAPKLAALTDKIRQNAKLFARIEAVHRHSEALQPDQRRLALLTWRKYARSGATLDAPAKAKLTDIHQELAGLYTTFSQNLLADEETWVKIDSADQLAGLPSSLVASLAGAAEEQGLGGNWIVMNTRSSVQPVLTYSEDRALRKTVWQAFTQRGDHAGEHDNKPLIRRILALRAERATLLGFKTHAHWALDDRMAGSPEAAMDLMMRVWPAAVERVEEEVADQEALAKAEGAPIDIAPWDYRYYQEKVRKQRYDLDENEVKPYLQLEKLREGMFWMAGELYGLQFAPLEQVGGPHPDVRVWTVSNAEGHVGLWYFDPYARTGKRSGAWMDAFRSQESFRGTVSPIVANTSNFVKGAPGEPVLISWDDASTLFHEFGHALHGLLSQVRYPGMAGTNVAQDYVEFPSQLHEHWLETPELLSRFATHVETGEVIPDSLLKRIRAAATFNQGFATTEYLASALIDMKLHLAGAADIDPAAFEDQTLLALGMPSELVMRHRTPQFGHVFAGAGYAAGYYSYLWSDTLTADTAEAFEEAGSMYDADVAQRLVEHVLSAGGTVDEAIAYRAFRGRDVHTDALLRKRGFLQEAAP